MTDAALLAVLAAYAVAAGIEWMWQLPIVSIVAFVCLGLIVAPRLRRRFCEPTSRRGTRPARFVAPAVSPRRPRSRSLSEGDQPLAQAKIQSSQSATAQRRSGAAFDDAVDARDLQPWAATPYLQIALVAEQQRELVTASQAIAKATDRAPDDWRLWLVRARIETKRGMIESGVQSADTGREA